MFTHGGRNKTGIDALDFAKKMEDCGAGELLVTSMDRDGTQVGYDIDLMSKISQSKYSYNSIRWCRKFRSFS